MIEGKSSFKGGIKVRWLKNCVFLFHYMLVKLFIKVSSSPSGRNEKFFQTRFSQNDFFSTCIHANLKSFQQISLNTGNHFLHSIALYVNLKLEDYN